MLNRRHLISASTAAAGCLAFGAAARSANAAPWKGQVDVRGTVGRLKRLGEELRALRPCARVHAGDRIAGLRDPDPQAPPGRGRRRARRDKSGLHGWRGRRAWRPYK